MEAPIYDHYIFVEARKIFDCFFCWINMKIQLVLAFSTFLVNFQSDSLEAFFQNDPNLAMT